MKTSKTTSPNAFTLLEMAIVLAILAVLTHLALSRLDYNTFKPTQARRQLDALHDAILGTSSDTDPAGQPTRLGFVADMGRLPRITTASDGSLTLAELWVAPPEASFAVRPATPENLAPNTSASDADPQVYLGCGWRGPYFEPTRHSQRLLDPWGNPFLLNDTDASENAPIHTLQSLGSDGAPGWDQHTETARDIAIELDDSASLTIIPTFRNSDHEIDSLPRPTRLRVYSPLGDKISVASTPLESVASGSPLTLSNLTPGPRVFRIERDGLRSEIRPILLAPGPNVVHLP